MRGAHRTFQRFLRRSPPLYRAGRSPSLRGRIRRSCAHNLRLTCSMARQPRMAAGQHESLPQPSGPQTRTGRAPGTGHRRAHCPSGARLISGIEQDGQVNVCYPPLGRQAIAVSRHGELPREVSQQARFLDVCLRVSEVCLEIPPGAMRDVKPILHFISAGGLCGAPLLSDGGPTRIA
jgi:hypothetical protein